MVLKISFYELPYIHFSPDLQYSEHCDNYKYISNLL